jgi:hypothetical protein
MSAIWRIAWIPAFAGMTRWGLFDGFCKSVCQYPRKTLKIQENRAAQICRYATFEPRSDAIFQIFQILIMRHHEIPPRRAAKARQVI